MDNTILVSDWEIVPPDDHYIQDEWLQNNGQDENAIKEIQQMAKDRQLYFGYVVPAINYAVYTQMDSQQVIIDNDGDILVYCESSIIGNNHKHRQRIDI